jgi:hypothetical protein
MFFVKIVITSGLTKGLGSKSLHLENRCGGLFIGDGPNADSL